MVVGGVDVVPTRAVSFLLENTVWVARRHDLGFMPGGYQPFRKCSRVVLHSANAVSCNGDNANAHPPGMLFSGDGPVLGSRLCALRGKAIHEAVTVS
jgi:hypothetical protein